MIDDNTPPSKQAVGAGSPRRRPAGQASALKRGSSRMAYAFITPYTLLALAFGIVPAFYAVYLAFTNREGTFAGLTNFSQVINDFRFWPAAQHVALYVIIWLFALVILVTLLALIVHNVAIRWASTTLRFVFYIPGALAGASSVLLWLFMLNPAASPFSGPLHAMGFETFVEVISPNNLPLVFAIIAFWAGAGGWIVIMYGALNNISQEVIEAARIDGAGPFQIARRIQIPMLRKWISYMGIISLAAGVQLFVEPQFLSQASQAVVPNDYSLNQLAYQYAFRQNDFNGAAAISLLLLVVALALSAVFVLRGGLFEKE